MADAEINPAKNTDPGPQPPGQELGRVQKPEKAQVFVPPLAIVRPSGQELGRVWPNGPPGGVA